MLYTSEIKRYRLFKQAAKLLLNGVMTLDKVVTICTNLYKLSGTRVEVFGLSEEFGAYQFDAMYPERATKADLQVNCFVSDIQVHVDVYGYSIAVIISYI